ncbi:MAG: EF-P beta-lysylation protein EpmB [Alteromonadaceae bacterium]|jgi:EF-P beta-lysylation protein EpmB
MPNTMIINTDPIDKEASEQAKNWQQAIAGALTNPLDLLARLQLSPQDFDDPISAKTLFPMRVPLPFIAKMKKGDPNDPLLLQVLPAAHEFDTAPGYSHDPLGEQQNQLPGLLHKYQSRVLIIFRGGCAVNCRYCFRRHFPYQDNNINKAKLLDILQYVDSHPQVNEVILSGGDPLMANDQHIDWFISQLERISHVTRLRIHSRLPVVIPQRLTDALATTLAQSRLNCVMVLHINHGNEIDQHLTDALIKFSHAGITLLNQAVLLKGINDKEQVLVDLSEKLFAAGILPYYLHLLDKVAGAAHFDVSEIQAQGIMRALLKKLPGFLVPKLVREIAGQPSKTPIAI